MAKVYANSYKGSASVTSNQINTAPISLPSLESLDGGQIQSVNGNENSRIGGLAGQVSGGIHILDGGAIDRAFNFGDGALNLAGFSLEQVVDLTAKVFEQNRLNTTDFYNQVKEASADSLDYVSTYANKEGEERKILQQVLIGAGVLAGLFMVLKFSKLAK